ncbi:MAG: acetolactate decarboxylase [Bacteroidales bacterium]|nr:acetolactate decarboxylase [Bacteroidales bacterium]
MHLKIYTFIFSLFSMLIFFSCTSRDLDVKPSDTAYNTENTDLLYQKSIINTLLAGVYDGETTFGELKQYGDFGIGTFDKLDGEMVGLDGSFYQIRADGNVYPVPNSMTTPFASVTFFESDQIITLSDSILYPDLCLYIDSLVPTLNLPYAVRIDGTFRTLKARSVPQQSKPYIPLVEVVEKQPLFSFENEKGSLIGFRLPEFLKDVNVPGYHFHFITEDKTRGGHLLDCVLLEGKILIDHTPDLEISLLEQDAFYQLPLDEDKSEELEKVEK